MARSARGALVHQKIRHGVLPRERAMKASSGYGLGHFCVACADRVNPPELQYDCVMASGETLHFCRECYFLWLGDVNDLAASP
jgi:hypothetical protein